MKQTPGSKVGSGYGWVSILLHWATVALVTPLWFIGYASVQPGVRDPLHLIHVHTTLAVSAWALLWARVLWRLHRGHPGPLPRQRGLSFEIGKSLHYLLVIAIGIMLVSGPLLAWTGQGQIAVFSASVPSPFPRLPRVASWLLTVHRTAADVIIYGILIHVAAVCWNMAFSHDGTLGRMIIAARGKDRR